MSWLNSPKKLAKLVLVFVLATALLLFLLPNSYAKIATQKTDSNADDHTSAPVVRKIETLEFNTTWDHGNRTKHTTLHLHHISQAKILN